MSHSSNTVGPQVDLISLRKTNHQTPQAKTSPSKSFSSQVLKILPPPSTDLGNGNNKPAFDTKSFRAAMLALREKTKAHGLNTSQTKKTAPVTPRTQANNAAVYGLALYNSRGGKVTRAETSRSPSSSRENKPKKSSFDKSATGSSMTYDQVIIEEKGISEVSAREASSPKKKRMISEEKKRNKPSFIGRDSAELKSKNKERADNASVEAGSAKIEREMLFLEDKKGSPSKAKRGKSKSGTSMSCFTSPKMSISQFHSNTDRFEADSVHVQQEEMKGQSLETVSNFVKIKKGEVDMKEYITLKQELESLKKEKEIDRKTIQVLLQQVENLQAQLKSEQKSSTCSDFDKDTSTKASQTESVKGDVLIEIKEREIDLLKGQNEALKMTNQMLRDENQILKEIQKQMEQYKEETKKYKELYLSKSRGEHILTEEGTSLKKDFKRAKSSLLKLHRVDSCGSQNKVDSLCGDAESTPSRIDSKFSLENFHTACLENFLSEAEHNLVKVLDDKEKGIN